MPGGWIPAHLSEEKEKLIRLSLDVFHEIDKSSHLYKVVRVNEILQQVLNFSFLLCSATKHV